MSHSNQIQRHFRDAEDLYLAWSPSRTMHHGYWQPGGSLDRQAMLDALTEAVFDSLQLEVPGRLADLGCGFGSSAAQARAHGHQVDGFSICEEQIAYAEATHASQEVRFHHRDYRDTGLPDASCDGAYAIESICYAGGRSKGDLLAEAHRILRPGARLVITDGFVLRSPGRWVSRVLDAVAEGWAVEDFPHRKPFLDSLSEVGFDDVRMEDWGLHIAPSVLQGQGLIVSSLARRGWRNRNLSPVERAHLKSALLGLPLGLARRSFRYLMISARRVNPAE